MKNTFLHLVSAVLIVAASAGAAQAQTPATAEKIPVKLVFVISRYDGDRKVSSLPFTLLAIANGDRASLNNQMNVPIVTSVSTNTTDGKSTTAITYTNIGTTIQSTVSTDSGRFKVILTIDDKSVMDVQPASPANPGAPPPGTPSFRDVNFNGTITLKEAESKQIISAATRTSGEVTKIDVTLTLDK